MDRSEIDSLKADLRRMQSRVEELETAGEEPVNRRNMLRGLGAAAAGAAVGGLAFARPAGAIDGGSIQIGNATQTAESPTMLVLGTASWSLSPFVGGFTVSDDPGFTNANAGLSCIAAYADSGGPGADHTIGLWASSTTGVGAKLDGPVPLKLTSSETTLNQASGTPGMFRAINGATDAGDTDLWFCVDDDGSRRWRKLAGPGSAGTFHAITPFRAYDSRAAAPTPGILATNTTRTISVADARNSAGAVTVANAVPAGASAVAANITVTGTTGLGGFLSVNPGGDVSQTTSAINWFGAGQNIANGLSLTLDTNRQLTVVCGAAGGDTHFIVDISGYYI